VINASCNTVDDAFTVEFDATPWFSAADAESIRHVAEQDWSSPLIAEVLGAQPGYESLRRLLDYAANRLAQETLEDPTWNTFTCVVNGPEALAWLQTNRPEIALALRHKSGPTATAG
jgi:hypothetical protein